MRKKCYSAVAEELKLHKLIFEKTYLTKETNKNMLKEDHFNFLLDERFNMLLGFDHLAKIVFQTKNKKENIQEKGKQKEEQQLTKRKLLKEKENKQNTEKEKEEEDEEEEDEEKEEEKKKEKDGEKKTERKKQDKHKWKKQEDVLYQEERKKENYNEMVKDTYIANKKVYVDKKESKNEKTCTEETIPSVDVNTCTNIYMKKNSYKLTNRRCEGSSSGGSSSDSNRSGSTSRSKRSRRSSRKNRSDCNSSNSSNSIEKTNKTKKKYFQKSKDSDKCNILSSDSSNFDSNENMKSGSDVSNLSPDVACYEKQLKHIYDMYKQNDKNVYLFANPPLCNCVNKKFKNVYFDKLYSKFPCLFGCFHYDDHQSNIGVKDTWEKTELEQNKREKGEVKKNIPNKEETLKKKHVFMEGSNNNDNNEDPEKEVEQINKFRDAACHAVEIKTYAKAFFEYYFLEEYFSYIMNREEENDFKDKQKSNGRYYKEFVETRGNDRKENEEEKEKEKEEEQMEGDKSKINKHIHTNEKLINEKIKKSQKEKINERGEEKEEEEKEKEVDKYQNDIKIGNKEIEKQKQKLQVDKKNILYFLNNIFQKNTVLKFYFEKCLYKKMLKQKNAICTNTMCCGLQYVPYSYMVVILNRIVDSLSYTCEHFDLPSNTDIYYNLKKNVITICTKNVEHEFFCYYALQQNKSVKNIFFYDVYYEGFLPFFKPLLNLGSKRGKEKLLTYLNNNKNSKLSVVVFLVTSPPKKQVDSSSNKNAQNENELQQKETYNDKNDYHHVTENDEYKYPIDDYQINDYQIDDYQIDEKKKETKDKEKGKEKGKEKEKEKEKEKKRAKEIEEEAEAEAKAEEEAKEEKAEREIEKKKEKENLYVNNLKLHICKIYDINHRNEYKMQLRKSTLGNQTVREISKEQEYFTNFSGRKEIINNVTINLIANKILHIVNNKNIICDEKCKYNSRNKKKIQNKKVKVYLCESVDSFSYDRRCVHIRKRNLITSAHVHFNNTIRDYYSNENNTPFVDIVNRELDQHIFKKKIRKGKILGLIPETENIEQTTKETITDNGNENKIQMKQEHYWENSTENEEFEETCLTNPNGQNNISDDYFFLFNENADLYTHEEYRKKKFLCSYNGRKINVNNPEEPWTAESRCLPKQKCLEVFQSFFNTYACSYLMKQDELWSLEKKKKIKKKMLKKWTDEYKLIIVKQLYYVLFDYYKEKVGFTLNKEVEDMLHEFVWKTEQSELPKLDSVQPKNLKRKRESHEGLGNGNENEDNQKIVDHQGNEKADVQNVKENKYKKKKETRGFP